MEIVMNGRDCPPMLEEVFEKVVKSPSDINEHLELLRGLASECEHVTEFGARARASTIALLAGQPTKLISWDINPGAVVNAQVAALYQMTGRTTLEVRVGNTLEISPIEQTDLLFIDTLHTARQLKAELERHCDPYLPSGRRWLQPTKYLAFHDTVTFGYMGEDGTEGGLRTAIRWFQKEFAFPLWKLKVDRQNNNGLVVLERA